MMRLLTQISCLAGAALLLAANGAAAQEAPPPQDTVGRAPSKIERRLGLDLLTGAIEGSAASQQGTGSRAWGFLLNGGVTAFRILDLSADVGVVDVSDKDAFTQNTTAGEKTSSVSAFLGTVAVGLRTPPLDLGEDSPATLSAGVNLGHTWLSAERSIANCVDCTEEDLEIRAGSFWEPGFHVAPGGGRRWGISARYRVYAGGSDLKDSVMLGVTGAL